MKIILFLLFGLSSQIILAQTKKIAFRSHSGNMENFLSALETGEGDTENSNFGMAPEPMIKSAQLDSVILICDTVAIMVTSEYCRYRREDDKYSSKWRAGKDTVVNHPLFSHYLSLDSIKAILKSQYHFRNPVEKVVFVGFDEPITMNRKRNEITPVSFSDNQNDSNKTIVLITSLIFGLSLLGGWVSWKVYKPAA